MIIFETFSFIILVTWSTKKNFSLLFYETVKNYFEGLKMYFLEKEKKIESVATIRNFKYAS